jgi:hypothetical protein
LKYGSDKKIYVSVSFELNNECIRDECDEVVFSGRDIVGLIF